MIQMTKTAAGPAGTWLAGHEYSLDPKTETDLVDAGSAIFVKNDSPTAPPEPETTEAPLAPENAAVRTEKPRRGGKR